MSVAVIWCLLPWNRKSTLWRNESPLIIMFVLSLGTWWIKSIYYSQVEGWSFKGNLFCWYKLSGHKKILICCFDMWFGQNFCITKVAERSSKSFLGVFTKTSFCCVEVLVCLLMRNNNFCESLWKNKLLNAFLFDRFRIGRSEMWFNFASCCISLIVLSTTFVVVYPCYTA